MKFSPRRLWVLPAFAGLLTAGLYATSGQEPEVTIDTHAAGGKVSYLTGRGGNIGVHAGPDGLLVIDNQFANLAGKIHEALKAIGGEDIAYLINTHWHGDHTGGNPYFGSRSTLVSHENVRRRLNADPEIQGNKARAKPQAHALPAVTYDGEMRFYFNGEAVRLMHFGPGHTDGDTVVWFTGSGVVHMGDLFFQNGFPFVDLDSGGRVEGVIAACKAVIERVPADTKVIPGHGTLTDVEGLKTYVAMIEDCFARVTAEAKTGKSVAEMVEGGLLNDYDERWGGGFINRERWIATLARDSVLR